MGFVVPDVCVPGESDLNVKNNGERHIQKLTFICC